MDIETHLMYNIDWMVYHKKKRINYGRIHVNSFPYVVKLFACNTLSSPNTSLCLCVSVSLLAIVSDVFDGCVDCHIVHK
jgi:hypothetical protein